jgi:hypothetical protein
MSPNQGVEPATGRKVQFDIGKLTTTVSVMAAFAYATGVVAINTYLHELGIVDFSFAKPKLLLTGILVLFTFLLLAYPLFFLAWSLARGCSAIPRIPPSMKGVLISIAIFFAVLIAASAFCFRNGPQMGEITAWQIWAFIKVCPLMGSGGLCAKAVTALVIALAVYLPVFVAAVAVYVAKRIFDQARSEDPRSHLSLRWFYFTVAVGIGVIFTIGYIYVFTGTFYPAIPQLFGGGEPYYEGFAIAEEGRCPLHELGIPFDDASITKPLPVLHETDSLVAVWLKKGDLPAAASNQEGDRGWSSRFVVAEIDKGQIHATTITRVAPDSGIPLLAPATCAEDAKTVAGSGR